MKLINLASEDDPVFCPNSCGHSYSGVRQKTNLKMHMMYHMCAIGPKFQCVFCLKQFKHKQSMKYHIAITQYSWPKHF